MSANQAGMSMRATIEKRAWTVARDVAGDAGNAIVGGVAARTMVRVRPITWSYRNAAPRFGSPPRAGCERGARSPWRRELQHVEEEIVDEKTSSVVSDSPLRRITGSLDS